LDGLTCRLSVREVQRCEDIGMSSIQFKVKVGEKMLEIEVSGSQG